MYRLCAQNALCHRTRPLRRETTSSLWTTRRKKNKSVRHQQNKRWQTPAPFFTDWGECVSESIQYAPAPLSLCHVSLLRDNGIGFFFYTFCVMRCWRTEWKELQENQKTEETKLNPRRFLCPVCGKHTVLWLLPTTEVKDLPVKCKLCGKESIVNISFVPAP